MRWEIELPSKAVMYTDRDLTPDEIRWIKWRWITEYGKQQYNAWSAPWPPPQCPASEAA